jgi:hypothetical protein
MSLEDSREGEKGDWNEDPAKNAVASQDVSPSAVVGIDETGRLLLEIEHRYKYIERIKEGHNPFAAMVVVPLGFMGVQSDRVARVGRGDDFGVGVICQEHPTDGWLPLSLRVIVPEKTIISDVRGSAADCDEQYKSCESSEGREPIIEEEAEQPPEELSCPTSGQPCFILDFVTRDLIPDVIEPVGVQSFLNLFVCAGAVFGGLQSGMARVLEVQPCKARLGHCVLGQPR